MLASLLSSFLALLFLGLQCSNSQRNVTFSAISILDSGTTGRSIVGAQWLAMQEINKNPDLLPGIRMQLNRYDSMGDTSKALLQALSVIDIDQSDTRTNQSHFPILLGCPWSSLSTMIAPALGAFNMGQISSGSTSKSLADTSKYPYFYRTIPSDLLQAKGIILLCKEFNWTQIAIVYVNDAYGLYLSIDILDFAFAEGIEATAVAFSPNENSTFVNAAYQVSQLDAFIIVFIVHDTALRMAFEAFEAEGLIGFPYYYIGVDAWLDSGSITGQNATTFAQGAIGTIPWQTLAMPLDAYDETIQPVVQDAMEIYDHMLDLWSVYWQNGNEEGLNVETPSTTSIYGYDAMYTLAYALEKYVARGYDIVDMNTTVLNEIIINEIEFIGASGNIVYDSNGDRAQGLYAFGNALEDGEIEYFGYFYQDDSELKVSVDYDKIVWPKYFTERGMRPQSSVITTVQIMTIDLNLLVVIYVLSILSMIIAAIYAGLTWYYRTHRVLEAASWKINLIMCVGCLFGYTSMIVYGVDEQTVSAGAGFSFLCNFRLWLWIMSYTLLFMPLFAKTYRLAQIFNEILEEKHILDQHLLYGILGCLVVDLVLLTLYTAIEPLERMHLSGGYEQINQLQRVHYKYGSCETDNGIQYIFYGLITLWKVIESLFGIYCALSVSRVGRQDLSQFDETTQQLLAIGFLIMVLCIAIPIGMLGGDDDPTYFYGTVGFLTISVGNVTTTLNMLPRLYAVVSGKISAYTQSPEQKVEQIIMAQLKRIGVDEDWWRHNTTIRGGIDITGLANSHSDLKSALTVPTRSNASNATSTASTVRCPPVEYTIDEDKPSIQRDIQIAGEGPFKSPLVKSAPDAAQETAIVSPLATHLEIQDVGVCE